MTYETPAGCTTTTTTTTTTTNNNSNNNNNDNDNSTNTDEGQDRDREDAGGDVAGLRVRSLGGGGELSLRYIHCYYFLYY